MKHKKSLLFVLHIVCTFVFTLTFEVFAGGSNPPQDPLDNCNYQVDNCVTYITCGKITYGMVIGVDQNGYCVFTCMPHFPNPNNCPMYCATCE